LYTLVETSVSGVGEDRVENPVSAESEFLSGFRIYPVLKKFGSAVLLPVQEILAAVTGLRNLCLLK
jgi:hypothetical protein